MCLRGWEFISAAKWRIIGVEHEEELTMEGVIWHIYLW
jgi:hypothetical protein